MSEVVSRHAFPFTFLTSLLDVILRVGFGTCLGSLFLSLLIHFVLVVVGFIFMVFMMVVDAVRPSIYIYF